jgi:uncharacterized membrane protein
MEIAHHTLPEKEVLITDLFRVMLVWRIVYGSFKMILGVSLLKFHGMEFADMLAPLMAHELSQDPRDVLVGFIHTWLTHSPQEVTYFLSVYFLFWGLIDIGTSYYLLKHKQWAYPVSAVLICIFVLYEAFRYTHTYSLTLLCVIIIDIVVLGLIVREYRHLKGRWAT